MTRSTSRLMGAVAIALMGTGCSPEPMVGNAPLSPASEPPYSYGEGLEDPTRSEPESSDHPIQGAPPDGKGTLELRLVDQNKRGPTGIPVRVQGPVTENTTSGKDGLVRLHLPIGEYTVSQTEGCLSDLNIQWGQSGRFSIVEGKTTKGTLGVRWEHRIRPFHPSDFSQTPYWTIGDEIEMSFYVADRCRNNNRAPEASYVTFIFELSPNLALARDPVLQADANGVGHVFLRCTSPGAASVSSVDQDNVADRLDLLEENLPDANVECRTR